MKAFAVSLLGALMLAPGVAWPDTVDTSTTRLSRSDLFISEDLKFNFGLKSSYSVAAEEQASGDRKQAVSYAFTPGFSNHGYAYSVIMSYEQDLAKTYQNGYGDPAFSVTRRSIPVFANDWNLKPTASLMLPVTDRSKNETQLLYNVGAGVNFDLNTAKLNMDDWMIGFGIAFNRNFTAYDTNAKGDPSNAYRLRQKYYVNYDLTDHFTISTSFDYTSDFDAFGVVTNTFMGTESLAYRFDRSVSLSVGHSNGGPILTPLTYDSNLKVYDPKASVYSMGMNIRI